MTIQSNIITITKRFKPALALCVGVALLIVAAAPIFAHGGFDHVMGTVVQVANHVVTVKTAKGNVDVKLDEKTELIMKDQKAQLTDLVPGARVVIDIPEGSKDMIAHSVKIGAVTKAADPHLHDSH